MKYTLAFLILCLFTSCSSSKAEAQEKQSKLEVTNSLTSEHIKIPATGVSLIPPIGSELSSVTTGFEKDGIPIVVVIDHPNSSYEIELANNNVEHIKSRGGKDISKEEIVINDFSATLFSMQMNPTAAGLSLIIGNSSSAAVIMAVCPINDSIAYEQIRESLLSVYYEQGTVSDPTDRMDFEFDLTNTKFAYNQYLKGNYVYTLKGNDIDFKSLTPILTVSQYVEQEPERLYELIFTGIEKDGYETTKEIYSSRKTVNGYDAFERIVDGNLNNQKCQMYFLVVSDKKKAVLIQGIVKSDFKNSIDSVRSLAHTIKLK
jgi:hypothetical protein